MANISAHMPTMNATGLHDLPPLPSYTLHQPEPLVPFISDFNLAVILPVVVYWVVSFFWHLIDTYDVWPQYRLHTPAEILKRNHVSRFEVFRDVIIQQVIQVSVGYVLTLTDPPDLYGAEEYQVAVWATRIRLAQRALPKLLALFGLNATALANNVSGSHPMIAGVLSGGLYPTLMSSLDQTTGTPVPTFAAWEMMLAKFMYWYLVPCIQFLVGILIIDTWQYFLHRAMHMNKWLYTTFHSRHHRLYVPYAYGALYNHPFEGFLLDTLGAGIAYKVAGMTARQGMWFFSGSTIKTIDDHCGYHLPWDPLQLMTNNNASYHDIHHQSWGIKTNFSQPFFTFWDRLLGTSWEGGDTAARYEKSRQLAQARLDADLAAANKQE